jgi:MFS transporter, DHA2 family, multidrug resistance protein
MTETGAVAGEPVVALKTWITVGGALIGAFMAVLNIQITNASLPYIEGGIGTGDVYGTWVSTASARSSSFRSLTSSVGCFPCGAT